MDWDKRYREGFYDGAKEPHGLLRRFWRAIPKGSVIDIASGSGRDCLFLAGQGFTVYGLERSREALNIARKAAAGQKGQAIFVQGDAERLPFRKNSVEGIMAFYFLARETIPVMQSLLKKGGLIIYETFLKRQNAIDRRRNPDFLLDDGELLSLCSTFQLLHYEETVSFRGGKRRAIAQYVGRKT
jgi:tellurite methyltransferase